jgi:phospholipid-translocating ATPase
MITERIKKISKKTVAAIGDGGNDVGMIQISSIGIGIVGKEGNHAALASDISILEFKYVKNLILWHGRNSYKRAAALSQFVIHRGLIISILQMAFSIIFYNVAIPIYNGMLMLGYATLYTSLPVFSIIFDEDVTLEKTMLYPNLYITLRKSRDLNTKTFFIWLWISIYQGVVIMVLSLVLFEQSFVRIVTITFTSLIISEILNVATTIHRLNKWIVGSQVLTLLIYALSLIFLNNYIDTSKIDKDFLWKVFAIVAVSWTPIHLAKCIIRRISPTEEDRITN